MCKYIFSHNKTPPHTHTTTCTRTHTHTSSEMSRSNITKLRMKSESNLCTFLHFFHYALMLSGLHFNNSCRLISWSGFVAGEWVRRFTFVLLCHYNSPFKRPLKYVCWLIGRLIPKELLMGVPTSPALGQIEKDSRQRQTSVRRSRPEPLVHTTARWSQGRCNSSLPKHFD